jgi:hypothetical protein
MDLQTLPGDLEVKFLLEFFDDAIADVAEGSDVIGKDLHAYGHENTPVSLENEVPEALAQ